MRLPSPSKFLLLILCCLIQYNVISAPLTIEIDHGIEAMPHETGDVDKNTSSSFVQIIDAADIRQNKLDLGQIIENHSGIKIRRLGGIGSYSQISIRGKTSDQVMIYVDGMPLNNASGGIVDLSQIPLNQIARIEIYKDIIPVEFSEASNGGVINIITHRSNNQKSTLLSSGLGSFGTYNLGLNHFNHTKNWQYIFSGGYTYSNNDFRYTYENGTPENHFDDLQQNRQNNELRQYNIIAKAKHHINQHQSIQYQTDIFKKVKNLPAYSNNAQTQASLTYDNQAININYINTKESIKNLKWNLALKASIKNTIFDDQLSQVSLLNQLIDENTKTISTKIYLKFIKNNYQLINNNSVRYEKLTREDVLQPEQTRSNQRMTLSSAFEGDFYFFENQSVIISPAIRFFLSQDKFSGNTLTESETGRPLNKIYYTASPQIGMRYQLWNDTHLKFNAGRYYRLPNYVELFGARGYIGSNETLKPEEGINIDAGFEHLSYPKSETFTKFNWNFSVFHSVINNEIEYSFDARGVGKPDNNHKSNITGLENNLSLEFNYSTELISNTNLLLPLNKSDPDNTKLLTGRSFLTQNTRLVFNKDAFEFFLEHVWESFYYFDTAQQLENPSKSIFNTGVKFSAKNAQYSVSADNVLNVQHKDFYSQVSPGLSIFISANFKFL